MKTILKELCSSTASSSYEIQSKKLLEKKKKKKAPFHLVCKQMQYLPGFVESEIYI